MRRSHFLVGVILRYILLISILIVMVFPLAWMFLVALMPAGSLDTAGSLVLSSITLSNMIDLFRQGGIAIPLFNSLIVGVVVTLGNMLFCFMVAYSIVRFRSITTRVLFGSVLLVLMIPAHVTIVPLYMLAVKTHMYDTYWALILPWLVNPIGIFLVAQYIRGIPSAMEEAARIDGAGELRILFRIVMPLCRPVLAVLAIQVFFTNWNSFLFPYILTLSDNLRTLPVALALYQGHQAVDWQHLMAGSSIAVIPVLLVFVIMQRQIIAGITAGAIKQ